MFYKLKKDYMLRGWKLLPTGVINRDTRAYKFLPTEKFSVLKLCDGQNEIFDDEQRKIIEELLSEGFIEEKNTPSPLEDVQKYKFYDNRFMHKAHWSITGKCNCECRHCYMSAPQHKVEEFTNAQCMDIIAQLAACGVQTISLTGGEALVRKDFWEIVDALTAADIKITTILSNGLLINEKFLSELEKRKLNPKFQISFDGIGCHDWIRGVEGAEKFAIRAIKLLREKNFDVVCAFGLHKGNLHVLRETVKKLAGLGVNYLRVAPISEDGEAFSMSDKILSTEETYIALIDYIPQYIADGAPVPISLMGIFDVNNPSEYKIPMVKAPEGVNIDRNCVCGSVRNSIHIDFNGFVMPCAPMSFNDAGKKHFSPIFDKPLKELLNEGDYMDFINTRLEDYFKANPTCAACEYKNRCSGGCRGNAMSDNGDGDLLGVDKATCKFFKGGYYDRVIALGEKLKIFSSNDVLRVAKRFNNSRRNYLLVNPLQGKHLPTKPSAALEMMNALGSRVAEKFSSARLVIGFAETATAIGAVVAKNLSDDCFYIQTTRENFSGTFVEFLEEHSHAPQQKLFAENFAAMLERSPSIVFVDDELSTGKTLLNVVRRLKRQFPALNDKKICAASIINRLSAENLAALADENISCVSLVKLNQNFDAENFTVTEAQNVTPVKNFAEIHTVKITSNPRRGVKIGDYFAQCAAIADSVKLIGGAAEVVVLGTEECMLPAIIVAKRLEENFSVATHSTTRSPIGISRNENYPIREGFKLRSFYDAARTTFIYNLRRYDTAVIVTDAQNFSAGLSDLTAALKIHGVDKIFVVEVKNV